MNMKTINFFLICLSLILCAFLPSPLLAQLDIQKLNSDSINQLKLDGKMTGQESFTNSKAGAIANLSRIPSVQNPESVSSALNCNCWVPQDATWQVAAFDGSGASGGPGVPPDYRNDDWSTVPLNLPFNFCFYGTNVDSVYINNNGNVSIGGAYSTFTASGFPNNQFVMIAPFWGDVDTRGPLSGIVRYTIKPTYMIVQWENVGYFSQQDDKLNSFQLIITDGLDPILPAGQNTSFCYKDMQWTTGSASGGVNGFGGTPATVGVNRGNGIDYIQVGLFDTSGAAYDGPYGNSDGIDALDNQSFYFNSCVSSSNIAPLVTAIQVCDTLKFCCYDTLIVHAEYLSPELGQTTTPGVNPNGMSGVSVLNSTIGNTASIDVQIIGSPSNIGFHTIYITGTDDGAPPLTNSTPVIVQVQPVPLTSFTFTPPMPVNPGTTVNFTNTTVGAFSYVWDFGDGSPTSSLRDPSHTYSTGGNYVVTLTATGPNGCSSTFSTPIIVVACATASFTIDDTLCINEPTVVTFTGAASAGAVFNWNFGSATVISGSGRGPYSIMWGNSGNKTVSLTVNDNPCAAISDSEAVFIVPTPLASFTSSTSLCVGDQGSVAFNGTAQNNATLTWNLGSGTILSGTGTTADPYNVQWNTAGASSISLIVNQNGCADTTQTNVLVNEVPTALFTMAPSVCAESPVQITYNGNASASATYNWNFGGGIVHSGSGQGPYSVSWTNPGNPNVSLSVSENNCNSVPNSIPILINAIPEASFNTNAFTCPDEQQNISFTGSASPSAIYTWTFGGANVASGSGAGPYMVSWSTSGTKSIGLVITDNGCADTSTFNVSVKTVPTSIFTIPSEACPLDTVMVMYTGNADPSATFDWTFGGANLISGSGNGPYLLSWNAATSANITLTVTENGCTSPISQNTIAIASLPPANAGIDKSMCSGTTLTIGSAATGGISYSWMPQTGLSAPNSSSTTVEGINQSVFPEVRKYILFVESGIGCHNSDTVLITINPVPVVSFTNQASQCFKDNKFQFYVSGSIIPGAQYSWDFGPDANPSQSNQAIPPPVHFNSVDTFMVSVSANFEFCDAIPFSDNVIVVADPVAAFTPLLHEGCVPLTVPFLNQSSGVNNSYLWNFGDNSSITDEQVVHVFTKPGLYSVELTTQNAAGCTDYIVYPNLITVNPLPQASFNPSPETANILEPIIQFLNTTPGINQYEWTFGDGDSSIETNPDHMYREIGSYEVTLYTTNIYGCRDSVTALVHIEDDYTFYVPNAFSPNGDGRNDTFSGHGTRIKAYHMDILDRWGLVIYSTDDINKPWDGKVTRDVQSDVYLYKILVTDNKNKSHIYTGHVSVIR